MNDGTVDGGDMDVDKNMKMSSDGDGELNGKRGMEGLAAAKELPLFGAANFC